MKGNSSQSFVPIKNIRDGVVELENGEYRMILMTNSLNLSLKGEDEQMAILSQFQNFLNSLEFSVQIFIKSRRMNIEPYMKLLSERIESETGELIKLQITEYISYIRAFSEETNIMSKQFFIVVPYMPAVIAGGGVPTLSFGSSSPRGDALFQEVYRQIEQRALVVSSGLTRVGLRVEKLETNELVELYSSLFNTSEEHKVIIN